MIPTKVETAYFFSLPINRLELPGLCKEQFTTVKRISLVDLIPNQLYVDPEVIAIKRKGFHISKIFVAIVGDNKILIDGHHTVVAKIMNGQRYAYCQTTTL